MPEFSPLHDDLDFLSPLSGWRAAELGRFITDRGPSTVVDVGCGWAELLLRVVASSPAVQGVGIDSDPDSIGHGRALAEARGIADRVDLTHGDAKQLLPDAADAVLCIGASHIWGPAVSEAQPLDYASALIAIREVLEPGMPAVFGEGIWVAEPTSAATEPLAGRTDEFVFMAELLDIATESGFLVMRTHQASLDEWDRFESGFTAGYVRWLLEHTTEHPEAEEVKAKLVAQRNAYFRGYRNIMGMAYLELIAA